METERSDLAGLVAEYGRPIKPWGINLSTFEETFKPGILLAIYFVHDKESLTAVKDAVAFGELMDFWKGDFYKELNLWFVRNQERGDLACDFLRRYGAPFDIDNPFAFKGLGWDNGNYWTAIANDVAPEPQEQGELFPRHPTMKPVALNLGDNETYQLFRRAWGRGEFESLKVYRLSRRDGEIFRSIYPWWIQRELVSNLREKEASKKLLADQLNKTA